MTAAAGRRYTEDEQARRMLVLALNGGSVSRAKKQLDGEGFNVSVSTLIRWKDAPRYLERPETASKRVEEGLVEE